MEYEKYIGVLDYIIIAAMLLISTAIGIRYRTKKDSDNTTKDYLMAGRNMPLFPVAASVVATMISATTMIGQSAETYKYGMQNTLMGISGCIGIVLAGHVFVPVYFNCGVSTVYEFLEIRYGKTTRYVVSLLFVVQMIFFMSVVLYGPVLALSAFSDLSVETSIIVIGLVCSFYCTMGGLKAVLWTDAFQAVLMFICLLVPLGKGISEVGMRNLLITSLKGQRLDVYFYEDFTSRYTFWSTMMRGILGGMAYYGTSQVEVQRFLTLRSISRAKCALYYTVPPSLVLFTMCTSLGLIFYAVFENCDPIINKTYTGITTYDQLLPYYIVSRMRSIPGLTGLCVAGIFSGALSSLSSALNSLSTVTVMDFILPVLPSFKTSETKTVYLAKALTLIYGIICIGFTFAVAQADSLAAVAHTLMSIMEGPMLAIYLIGVLTRKGDEKSTLFGLVLGVIISSWLGYGNIFSGHQQETLPLGSNGCSDLWNVTNTLVTNSTLSCRNITNCLPTSFPTTEEISKPFILYRLSFVWLCPVGCLATMLFVFSAMYFTTGWSHNAIPEDSPCLSPVIRLWKKKHFSKTKQNENINNPSHELSVMTTEKGTYVLCNQSLE